MPNENPQTPHPHNTAPVSLDQVLKEEHLIIDQIRALRGRTARPLPHGARRHPVSLPEPPAAGHPQTYPHDWQTRDTNWVDAIAEAHHKNLVGLAFSGGGIRSATFNLGVLQALAELKLLHRIDYLSTVSGGGYIGSWLAAWTSRLRSFGEVQRRLVPNRVDQLDDKEPSPIRFLRVFSNYLTPKLGALSGDTLTMIAIYLRNMFLNQVIVIAMVAAALLLPRLVVRFAICAQQFPGLLTPRHLIGAVFFLLLIAIVGVAINLDFMDHPETAIRRFTLPSFIFVVVALPIFLDAILGGMWLVSRHPRCPSPYCSNPAPLSAASSAIAGGVLYLLVWGSAMLITYFYRSWLFPIVRSFGLWLEKGKLGSNPNSAAPPPASPPAPPIAPTRTSPWHTGSEVLFTLVGAALAGALAGWLYSFLAAWSLHWFMNAALTVGGPLVLAIFLLTTTLHIGLMGLVVPERRREWWGRLGGVLLLLGILWALLFSIALYFPGFISDNFRTFAANYLTPTWMLITLAGVLVAKSRASGRPGTPSPLDAVAKVAPYVFLIGLFSWISYAIDRLRQMLIWKNSAPPDLHSFQTHCLPANAFLADLSTLAVRFMTYIAAHRLLAAILVCLVVAFLMAWRVDINDFSMHLFYRNRLVRCYLGASNESRSPTLFTGFDETDNIPLKDLCNEDGHYYDGPYPILNASLNLVKGQDLAWQERKAASFVMTPKYCGYDVWLEEQDSLMLAGPRNNLPGDATPVRPRKRPLLDRFGYRLTKYYAFPSRPLGDGHGLFLGTAMSISGAAASPNMGYYTSTPVAFLMTVFNVRLGQWAGNTRHTNGWLRSSPGLGISYMVNELLAGTDDNAKYVYLSDGGHFENLGIYELVKRRCGLIIVGDAEADGAYGFGGLSNAIRKCRIDLGIEIDLDVSAIAPKKAGRPGQAHCTIGTIHYEMADLTAPTGTIIYFKSSLTGDEPADLATYNKSHSTFPHETTIDQWFTESQFESYRKLGYHIATSTLKPPAAPAAPATRPTPAPTGTLAPAPAHDPATLPPGTTPQQTPPPEHQHAVHHDPASLLREKIRATLDTFAFDTSSLVPQPAANHHRHRHDLTEC
jgi:hypothetical protein